MMRALTKSLLCAGALATGLVAGCYDEPGATVYEPGVYKGERDPLLDKLQAGERQEALRERFRTVQVDR